MVRRYALFSVTDRTGLEDFARGLVGLGWEILATRGTARALAAAGIPVTPLEEWTGAPEILGGRVKTLHPLVHAGILARPTEADWAELAAIGGRPIDLVAVNLYAFEEAARRGSMEEAVEAIDIGGVALLRAAAKNFARVIVCSRPADYPLVLQALRQEGEVPLELRRRLAAQAFRLTAWYDAMIARYLEGADAPSSPLPEMLLLSARPVIALRYGENPHQAGAFYLDPFRSLPFEVFQGKPLSYNNLLDLEAAWRAAQDLPPPAAVIVKHNNPCGAAVADTPARAFRRALAGDPESAYGGIVAFNAEVDEETAEALREIFLEVIAAPAYRPEAMAHLARKKACRVIRMQEPAVPCLEIRSVLGGFLVQTPDREEDDQGAWQVVTRRPPAASEWEDLRFAWRVVRHVRSNAIVLARGRQTVGIGAGQMSRVDAVRIAIQKAGERARGAVLASDAFFPFPDGVEVAAAAGVTAIIQPGGSIRDSEVIEAADRYGMAMAFTGRRCFRH
nr:bifunctional phosphoribosylaminoimidazolecarboxamide formyltransferase/IMP cyclohydrolase [Thermoflexus sp.]